MAEDLQQVEIQIVLDDGSIQKGFVKVKKEGDKAGKSLQQSLGRGFSLLNRQVLALGAGLATAFAGRAILNAAKRQEEAVNDLNSALKLAGEFSQQSSKDIQDFANEIQRTTTVGDEAALEVFNLARAFTATNEEAKKLTTASIELSARTGLSLESSVKNLGKTFGGLTGELGETLPAIKDLSVEALKAGGALDFVIDSFGGAAAAKTKTFTGATENLSNKFGDLLETIGFVAIKSPALIAAINFIGEALAGLSGELKEAAPADALKGILTNLTTFAQGINSFVVLPIEKALRGLNFLFQGVSLLIAKLFGGDVKAATEGFNEALKTIGDESVTTAIGENLVKLKDVIATSVAGSADPVQEQLKKTTEVLGETLQTAEQNTSALVGGVSGGFAAMGKAFAEGEDAFGAFATAIVASFGDWLVQLGTAAIAVGIGAESVKASITSLNGGAAIAAGAALVVLGSAFKALAGGPAKASSGASGGGVAGGTTDIASTPTETTAINEQTTANEPRNEIVVNVQGNVLDRRESGLEIVSVINEYFDNQGGTLVRT